MESGVEEVMEWCGIVLRIVCGIVLRIVCKAEFKTMNEWMNELITKVGIELLGQLKMDGLKGLKMGNFSFFISEWEICNVVDPRPLYLNFSHKMLLLFKWLLP